MPAEQTLRAVMTARENVSDALNTIADSGFVAAEALDAVKGSADATENAFDALERGGEGTAESLGDVATSGVEAAGSLSLTEARADELGDELSEATAEGSVLAGVLSSMPAADVLAEGLDTSIRAETNDASFLAAGARLDALTRDRTVNVDADVDRDSFALPQLSGGTVPFTAGAISAPDASPDTQTIPFRTGGVAMPSLSPDIQSLDFEAALSDGGIAGAMPALAGQSIDIGVSGSDELATVAASGHLAAEGLDATRAAAVELTATSALAASETEDVGESLFTAVPGGKAFAHTLGSVRDSAFAAVPGLTAAKSATDEYGDEASEAAVETAALQTSMSGLGSTGVGTEFLGFHGSVASMAALLPIVIAGVGGLISPLAAVAAGGSAAGGALAGLFGAGLLQRGSELTGTLQEVDGELKRVSSSGEGAQIVLGRIKDRAADMLAPLQDAQSADFFSGIVEGGLDIFEDAVALTDRLSGDLYAMSDRLGDVFAIEEPRFFAEMEQTVRSVLPALETFAEWGLGAVPDALRWIREEGVPLIPTFADLGQSVLDLALGLAELGGTIWKVAGPGLGFLFDVGSGVLDTYSSLPEPIQEAGVAAALAAGGAYLLAGALAGVELSAISVGAVLTAISWPLVAVGALAGAAYLAADHFGLLNDAVSIASGLWNGFLSIAQWTANTLLNLYDMAKPILMLIPGISSLVWLFDNWRAVVDVLGDALAFVVGKAKDLVKWLDNLSGFDEFVGKFIGKADDRGPNQPRVDLSGMKAGDGKTVAEDARNGPGGPQGPQQPPDPGGPGGYGGGSGMGGYGGGPPPAAGAAATTGSGGSGGTTINNTVEYYEQNGDSKSEVARERRVRNIVRQMNSETRRSGTGLN